MRLLKIDRQSNSIFEKFPWLGFLSRELALVSEGANPDEKINLISCFVAALADGIRKNIFYYAN